MMPDRLFDLTGRVAVISGAASGMGRASALALAEHGADLLIADLNEAGLQQTARDIETLGRRVVPFTGSVSDFAHIAALYGILDREFGGQVDFLANIAGEGILGAPEAISLEQVQQVFQNLVLGRFKMCQEAGRRMLKAGHGSIVNIGSLASMTALGR